MAAHAKTKDPRPSWLRRVPIASGLVCVAFVLGSGSASAAPVWTVSSTHGPTNMPPGEAGEYVIQAYNAATNTTTDPSTNATVGVYTVTDALPSGISFTSAAKSPGWSCSDVVVSEIDTVTCTSSTVVAAATAGVTPAAERGAAPVLYLDVAVAADASGTQSNAVTISGGGAAASAQAIDATTFDGSPTRFGLVGDAFGADAFEAASPAGSPVRQAGAHPFEARFDLAFNLGLVNDPTFGVFTAPVDGVHDIAVELPNGFVGNPEATPKCTENELLTPAPGYGSNGSCPADTQVGSIDVFLNDINAIAFFDQPNVTSDLPVYNMVPARGEVADLAFVLQNVPVHLVASVDPSNHYAVKTTIRSTLDLAPIRETHLALWGVPALAGHDALRFNPKPVSGNAVYGTTSGAEPVPFLTLPSRCDSASSAQITIDSWQDQTTERTYSSTPVLEGGCEKQQFAPSIAASPSTRDANAPAGLSFDLSVPQASTASGLGTPPVRSVSVQFPDGMRVSPSSANGLAACTPEEIGLGNNDEPSCPDASKIGDAVLTTPLLPTPVMGAVYLATQNANPFGSLLALYIVLDDPDRGLVVKLPGQIAVDATTGQITATFDDNPQLPFSNLHVQLKSGPRAPLTTPPTCGPKTVTATITPWNETLAPVTATSQFTIDGSCQRGFSPTFSAGTENPVAGRYSPLVTSFGRSDGDNELRGVDISLPRGAVGKLAGVPLCAEGDAASGHCGEASRIGTVVTGAGPGSSPYFITDGAVYLTGPYRDAPLGLSIVVHAKAGPFDLGTVVVRAAVDVDRRTAALHVASDPLPTVLQGIPLQIRSVYVRVDRPSFTLNPTSCAPMAAQAVLTSTAGDTSARSARFQVGDCGALAFRPRLTLRVGGRGHLRPGQRTPLTAVVTMPRGNANLSAVDVSLPTTLNARLGVVNRACTVAQFEAGHCESARTGTAVAVTPLLDRPLRGGVYFVRNGRPLPDIMVALRGQVDVDLDGRVSIPGGKHLATSFKTVPDVAVSRFSLSLVSDARHGAVGVSTRNLCTAKARRATAAVTFRAQNGKSFTRRQALTIGGCGKARAKKG